VRVKVVRPDIGAKHDVIVQIQKLVRQARDAVQMGLYGRRAKRGEMTLVGE
jgi:hypothetical protein